MRLGQHLWGDEALEGASELMVLEPLAVLPSTRAQSHQLCMITSHADESYEAFLKRVESRVGRLKLPVRSAYLCLNPDTGWKVTLARAHVCRLLAATVTRAKGHLTLLSPRTGVPQVALELLTLVDLIRQDFPNLDVRLQTETPALTARGTTSSEFELARESAESSLAIHTGVAA